MNGYNDENKKYNFDPLTGERLTGNDGESVSETTENTYDAKAEDPFFKVDPEEAAFESTENRADGPTGYQQYSFQTEDKEPEPEKNDRPKKSVREKKPAGIGRKFAVAIAIALVCGLVGGTVFYGVNYIGNRFFAYNPSLEEKASASAEPSEETKAIVKEETKKEEAAKEETTLSSSKTEAPEETQKTDLNVVAEQSSTATIKEGSVAEVAANCMPSLVTIASVSVVEMQNYFGQTQRYEAQSGGSGVIVGMNDNEMLIATNAHVVRDSRELSVGFIDESVVEAYIKGTDEDNDLAVIAVKLADVSQDTLDKIKIATIGNSNDLVLGEQVVVIGNALGIGQSVTSGYVSALNRDMTFSDGGSYTVKSTQLIQTDAPINSGNSGGGLFNMRGELVGINEAKSSMTASGTTVDGVGFAISIDKAKPILEELMNLVPRETVDENNAGYLGVNCANVTSDIAQMYAMPEGVCFTNVVEGSPAEKAGAIKGDVLVEFAGKKIGDYEDLKEELSYHPVGETVELKVMRVTGREYEEVTLNVTLASYDEIQSLQTNG